MWGFGKNAVQPPTPNLQGGQDDLHDQVENLIFTIHSNLASAAAVRCAN